jgi:kynurenine 3-monooxygenase
LSTEPRIVLAGGGLVGSLLAVMLGQRGLPVTVYEKRPDMRRTTISAGRSINLALAERGLHALRLAGLKDQVEPLLIPMRGRMLHPLEGSEEFSSYGQRPHEVIYSVARGLLNQVMLSAAEATGLATIAFRTECIDVDLANRRMEMVDLESGRRWTEEFDILLGTDGAASAVRTAIVEECGGTWHTEWLDHDYKELEIPAGAEGKHQLEKNALHIWPRRGFMLIALPNLDGSFTVTLFLNKSGVPSSRAGSVSDDGAPSPSLRAGSFSDGPALAPGFDQLTSPAAVNSFFSDFFPDARTLIPDLAADFFANPTGSLGTVRCEHWTDGQEALLLGDASHAIVPFHGQGMNAGFEDCAVLLELLDRHPGDWPVVMRAFEQRRRPDARAIATMALENYVTMRDSVLDPRFQLKKELGFELERRLPERFIPRYSMVMFHRIPYHLALERGAVQEQLLDELTAGKTRLEEIDLALGERMVLDRLEPVSG